MRFLILLFFLVSCAHKTVHRGVDDTVSVQAALMQAQASYLKGCVDGLKQFQHQKVFNKCRDMAIKHQKEIKKLVEE